MAKSSKQKIKRKDSSPQSLQPKTISKEQEKSVSNEVYHNELKKLQIELVKFMESIKRGGLKVCVVFEGRDGAGKGGAIKRIIEHLNPRFCRVVALGKPTEREQTQWFFQRYVAALPAAGELALFDRSWYNRAIIDPVMGFCTDQQYREFLRACPEFECMLIRSGIILVKYWFSVSDDEQERRFQKRINDPLRRWKLSAMDLEARSRWVAVSQAKDAMFEHTDIDESPWFVVEGDYKRSAQLNCINHLLSLIDYEDVLPEVQQLPPRQSDNGYKRPPKSSQRFVPHLY